MLQQNKTSEVGPVRPLPHVESWGHVFLVCAFIAPGRTSVGYWSRFVALSPGKGFESLAAWTGRYSVFAQDMQPNLNTLDLRKTLLTEARLAGKPDLRNEMSALACFGH